MRWFFPAAALAVLTFCSPANDRRTDGTETASDGSAGLSSRDTAPAPPADTSAGAVSTPAAILSQMNVANTAEIQLGRMAAKKAASPEVKRIAEKLAVDHSKNREQVRDLAQKLNVPLTPAAGGDVTASDSVALPSDLESKSGAEFDRAFVEHQIEDHESNIQKIQSQMLPTAQDPQVKIYLQRTLADMQGHLASLKEVQQKIGG